MESFSFFDLDTTCIETICRVEKYYNKSRVEIFTRDKTSSYFLFIDKKYRLACDTCNSNIMNLIKMAKLFYLDELLIKIEKDHYLTWLILNSSYFYSHKMNRAFTENKFYLMIFALALTRSAEEVEKFRSHAFEKYTLLKSMNYFPLELSLEISSYLIEFILMCMM